MSRVVDFLNEAKTYFLATTDGNQPKLRPFGGTMEYQGKVYISTNNTKNVYAQMKKNPKIEIVAMSKGKWIRITGKAVEDSSMEARKEMLESHPFLQHQYKLDDGIFTIFYIEDMKAVLNGFGGEVEEI